VSQQQFSLKRLDDGTETAITEPMVAGRNPDCGLRLPDGGPEGGPSRKHAQLSIGDGALWVEDLGSKNGTFVNDARVTAKTRLRSGDRLRFDRVAFVVSAPPEDDGSTLLRPADSTQGRILTAAISPAALGPAQARPASAAPPQAQKPATVPPAPVKQDSTVPQPAKPAPASAPAAPRPSTPPAAASPPPAAPQAAPARPVTMPPPEAPPRPDPVVPVGGAPAGGGTKEGSMVPGAWADPDAVRGDGKTVLISPDRVKEMINQQPARAASGEVDVPTLTCVSGPQAGRRFKLQKDKGAQVAGKMEWSLGSDIAQDVVLTGDGVSAMHASVVNEGERWKIIDRLSSNGTFVNNRRTNSSFLASGDEVRLGMVACVFELPGGPSPRRMYALAEGRPARRQQTSKVDVVTLVISFALTAAAIFVAWRYFMG
jgi:pSer/pThr/pTyr-binding forkhead associated (FHA) protein